MGTIALIIIAWSGSAWVDVKCYETIEHDQMSYHCDAPLKYVRIDDNTSFWVIDRGN